MTEQDLQVIKPRLHLRLRMHATEPVYVVTTVDNARLDLAADDLGGGGARLKVPMDAIGNFEVGQPLGQSLLVLPEIGLPIVTPVVRWIGHNSIGVEFEGITERQKEMIFKFLFRLERSTVRYLVS